MEACYARGAEPCFARGAEACYARGAEACYARGAEPCYPRGAEACYARGAPNFLSEAKAHLFFSRGGGGREVMPTKKSHCLNMQQQTKNSNK